MRIVIDASIALDWFLVASSAVAEAALDTTVREGAVVPMLWRWEVQDVLRRLALAGRLTSTVDAIRAELLALPIVLDNKPGGLFGAEASIAGRYSVTLYDAAYLELALRLQCRLATNDEALRAAASAANLLFVA